ncbi:MAG TPA: cobalamin B12-binding domain-containing protein, partial [Firmicutes bacterium]|nr:cobalamin B12-binding domain-containing protein [Bacillota bacterium]
MAHGMQVVICSLNSQYIHSSLAPWYLLAGIAARCSREIRATVIEGTVNEDKEAVLRRILRHKPQAVAFSCYIWNITRVKELVPVLK